MENLLAPWMLRRLDQDFQHYETLPQTHQMNAPTPASATEWGLCHVHVTVPTGNQSQPEIAYGGVCKRDYVWDRSISWTFDDSLISRSAAQPAWIDRDNVKFQHPDRQSFLGRLC